jgi:hypothetical protein
MYIAVMRRGSARNDDPDDFFRRLVVRPGRKRDDQKYIVILQWIIARTAAKFDPPDGEWATIDDLACAYVNDTEVRTDPDDDKLDKFSKALLRLPPVLGDISDEHVRLTSLGLLLAATDPAKEKCRRLTAVAVLCHDLFQTSDKRVLSKASFVSEYQKFYGQESAEAGRAREAADLVFKLPFVSTGRGPDGSGQLTILRSVLEYDVFGGQSREGTDIGDKHIDVLRRQMIKQVDHQLGLRDKGWKKSFERLNRWGRLLQAIILQRHWQNEVAIDSGPPWLLGNDRPEIVPETTEPDIDADASALTELLGVYAAQFGSYTTLLWQVPALSLTAQSFLMTIALGDNSNVARLIASVLSIMIAGTSISLMHNQRGHAINHGELALRVSRRLGLARRLGRLAIDDAKPEFADAETVWVGWDRHIYHVWKVCLGLFIAADVGVIIMTIVIAVLGKNTWWSQGS